MSLPKILIVDDEPQIQRFLKPALTTSDFEVLTAATASEALRLATARRSRCIGSADTAAL